MLAEDYNITLEEALEKTKHRPDFQKKIKHSVDLLRKAESLALKYDSEDGFYLAFSCGKDSQAMFHVAKMAGVKFKAHMNFTSVDPPQVIIFMCYPFDRANIRRAKTDKYITREISNVTWEERDGKIVFVIKFKENETD